MKVEIVKMTPALAKSYLELNVSNRRLKPAHVDFLARQMAHDEWIDNGQPIQMTKSNKLINGQHRLHAIVKTGITQSVVVVSELPEKAFKTIDVDSAPRNLATVLELEGHSNCTNLAAAIRMLNYFLPDGNYRERPERLSTAEAEDIMEMFPEIYDWARIGANQKRFVSCPVATSIMVGCGIVFGRSNWTRVSPLEFVHMVATGEGLERGDPALTLRNRMIRVKMSGGDPKRKETVGMLIRAWNYTQEGKSIRAVVANTKMQRVKNLPSDWADPINSLPPE